VDPWKTYVFQTTDESLSRTVTLTLSLILQRGRGKARFCVSRFYMSVQGYS
jgi:hypothetical protein